MNGDAEVAHEAGDVVPAHGDALALQRLPDLLDPVHAVVLLVHLQDLALQLRVGQSPRRRLTRPGGVVRGGGDGQVRTDRLDPEAGLVLVDEAHHFGSRGSSSRAKKDAAAFRISLERRNSRFSFSSSAMRRRSSVVIPGRVPPSISACFTQ